MDRLSPPTSPIATARTIAAAWLERGHSVRWLSLAMCLVCTPLVLADLPPLATKLIGVLTAAAGLGLVIFLHELGHFAVAKWCDVKVERFSIGFGPAILAKTYGETEYALCALPLGGYVKMLGQDDSDASQMTDEEIRNDPRSYTAKSVPKRMAIISAGVIMNVITGLLFFAIAYGIGVREPTPIVGSVSVGSPAWRSGVSVGDRITSINGSPIDDFTDIMRGTALSRGELEVMALTREGDAYSFTTMPDESGPRRQLGIGQMKRLEIFASPDIPAAFAGTPAAELDLRKGDEIVAVDGEPVSDYIAFLDALAERRGEEVELTVAREGGDVSVMLPPQHRRELGFQLDLGPVEAVAAGSVAEEEGIAPGDRITKVDGIDIGVGLSPIDLPAYLADKAGETVVVTIVRDEGVEPTSVDLTLTPVPSRPWLSLSTTRNAPLAVPSLGLTAPIIPTVLGVDEGSVAAEAGLTPGASLLSVTFGAGEPTDALGGAAPTLSVEDVGWPYIEQTIQDAPNRELTLLVRDNKTGNEHSITLPPSEGDEFLVTDRGLRLMTDYEAVKAESVGAAFAMAGEKTVTSMEDIYLTIRSLFAKTLSVKELTGPIGIASIGYQVAKNSFPDFLLFLGFLSINLAVINFLPIPLLDGGHMVFLLWEAIFRRPPSTRVIELSTLAGLVFVGGLMLFVIGLDVTKMFGGP